MDKRERTDRMPLGTFFWMPFFEAKVQNILKKMRRSKDEHFALWAYCEVAALAIDQDSKSWIGCTSDRNSKAIKTLPPNGTWDSFELAYVSSPTLVAKLFLELSRFRHLEKPSLRHKIAAYSEAESSNLMAEKLKLRILPHTAKNIQLRDRSWIFSCAIKCLDAASGDAGTGLISWKDFAFDQSWTPDYAMKKAESERQRRKAILREWPKISQFAPASILPKKK